MNTSEGQHWWDILEAKLEGPDLVVLDTCRGGRVDILVGGCSRWSYQGRRQRGRPKRRFIDLLRKNMQVVDVREDAENRERWRRMVCYGVTPRKTKVKPKEEERL